MTLMLLLLIMSFIMLWLNHPISMGITIIIITILTAMISGLMLGSFWYSYIILITMLSGMLVLFIYMASVASNEKFKTPVMMIMAISIMIMLIMTVTLLLEDYYKEMNNFSMINKEIFSLNLLFNIKNKFITMMLVLYLFFTMMIVSFIVNISEGPLRINKK
uniref:NADH-ubiquinone oxidoreductase chain 6 n=1 Tax=Riptortus pedestris TaxID=329032 RepID=B7SMM8_RIPPE|nr:NADH dehydrogenase subunit 6 [Riptortus pedestris]ABZ02122.1 NADH dehydrogenase subunit 6 [Riptortus pedestris]